MNLKETITKRKSVRKYADTPVSQDLIDSIQKDLSNYTCIFSDSKVRFEVISNLKEEKDVSLGTLWGLLKINSPCCILGIYEVSSQGMLDLGFALEQQVLKITAAGYGSCWFGNFNANSFAHIGNLSSTEKIGIIISFGLPKEDTFLNTNFRKIAGSTKRKPISEICLNYDNIANNSTLIELIHLSILAPSANNAQPVRIGIDNNRADFYLTNNITIDAGIFISHFYLYAKSLFSQVSLIEDRPLVPAYTVPPASTYIASIIFK